MPETRAKLKALLGENADGTTALAKLREDPARSSLESILVEVA